MKLPTFSKLPMDAIKQTASTGYSWVINQTKLIINSIKNFQAVANKNTRAWLSGSAPIILELFDKLPKSIRNVAPFVPWVFLLVFTLNLFDVFEKTPQAIKAQDPSIVIINPEVQKMLAEGEAVVGPYIEVIRVSGRIDFHESHLARIGANVTGRVAEMHAIPGQVVKQGDILAQITSTELTQSQLAYLKARNASDLAERAAERSEEHTSELQSH